STASCTNGALVTTTSRAAAPDTVATTSSATPACSAAGESSGTATKVRGRPAGTEYHWCESESPTAVGVKPNDKKFIQSRRLASTSSSITSPSVLATK